MKTWTVSNLEEMKAVVADIYPNLLDLANNEAVTLALHGNLGAGKTTFVQFLAEKLGITESVTSPTFVIMKRYAGVLDNPVLVHIDAYRVENVDEMRVLGFEGLLAETRTIICIEWAEKIEALLPPKTIHLNFELLGDVRQITLTK